jgi:chlorobactene glucosyltransferase
MLLHLAITALLTVVLMTALGNILYLWVVGRRREEGEAPLVSVLVPARDEAARIGACLEGLARQRYERLEVIVLDDCSEDRTGEIARSFEGRVPGLRVLDGEPLPPGWVGKPHACARLAREARGAWLLFTDADVVHAPESVARAMAIARATGADLLTALPRQQTATFAERLVIPLLYFLVAGFLPMFALPFARWWRLAAASGQYMLFRREAYEAIGGHEAVRDRIVEDVELARAVRRARRRLVIADGRQLATCRMYEGWDEIVEGFSKNAFAGAGGSAVTLALMASVAIALFVVPPAGLVVALAVGAPAAWFAAETALALASRIALALYFRQPPASALLHPLAVLAAIRIALRSFWLTRSGAGVAWRGRRYGAAEE